MALRKSSVNAKQLEQSALQAEPSRCESGHGRHFDLRFTIYEPLCIEEAARKSPIVNRKFLKRSQSVISSARRSAKAEVRGASPRESTISSGLWCNEQHLSL